MSFLSFGSSWEGEFVCIAVHCTYMYTVCCDVCACICVCTVSSTLIKYQPVTHPYSEGVIAQDQFERDMFVITLALLNSCSPSHQCTV